MELTQLKYFQTAARYEHFTKAAADLHITQPTLSKAIITLETELDLRLFDREGKNIRLNAYGEALLGFADRLFVEYDDLLQRLSDMNDPETGRITVSFAFADYDPSSFVTCFRSYILAYPKITLCKYQQNLVDIIDSLKNRNVDFGVALFPVETAGVEWMPLFSDSLGIQVANNSPYAGRKSVSLGELRNEPFISASYSPDLMDTVTAICRLAGFNPRIVFNSNNPLFTSELVSRGKGINIMAESRYKMILGGDKGPVDSWSNLYRFIPLDDDFCNISVGIFYLKGRYISAAAESFLEFIKTYFKA